MPHGVNLNTHLQTSPRIWMKAPRWLLNTHPQARPQWLSPVSPILVSQCIHLRRYKCSAPSRYRPLETLEGANITTFREKYFVPERPVLLPRGHFQDLPAFTRWFHQPIGPNVSPQLNTEYLAEHGADALVPLELTQPQPQTSENDQEDQLSFRKFHAPLSLFLEWIRTAEPESQTQTQSQSARLYLAQCQLLDLPPILRDDFPTPTLVAKAGKGDVYDTNVWIGYPPTYTPLHRDPNPNLFVQLAGRKVVRLLAPREGQAVFSAVRGQLGQSGNREASAFRGEEMMQGRERALLEREVWDDVAGSGSGGDGGFEAEVRAGDGLFIPKGWWHSIKGVGEGVTASVNWWFR